MKKFITIATLLTLSVMLLVALSACRQDASSEARQTARDVANQLQERQPVPTDIQASLERHNLIRRSYWINGMQERALTLPNPVPNPPVGYIILFAPNGGVVGRFEVDGKVTSLNYSLVPYSEYFQDTRPNNRNRWIANPGGVYGANTNGIFWFTPCGRYMEWNGTYLFSDVPFVIDDPIVRIDNVGQ
ncbi:MAG: hypothetical protein FWB93_05915 [Oscillospiraceae bacterium]|nr:hypothetical protein [Oscillospiraceae bacterium]